MLQDTVEIYLAFFMCYLILFPLQVHAVLRQRHIVPRLFTSSVTLELTAGEKIVWTVEPQRCVNDYLIK